MWGLGDELTQADWQQCLLPLGGSPLSPSTTFSLLLKMEQFR